MSLIEMNRPQATQGLIFARQDLHSKITILRISAQYHLVTMQLLSNGCTALHLLWSYCTATPFLMWDTQQGYSMNIYKSGSSHSVVLLNTSNRWYIIEAVYFRPSMWCPSHYQFPRYGEVPTKLLFVSCDSNVAVCTSKEKFEVGFEPVISR